MSRVLFLFLDGVGIGPGDPARNPFLGARLPCLRSILGGRLPVFRTRSDARVSSAPIPLDARLETEGTPRSGTGQVSVLTGRNAALLFGGHFGPWTPVRLRPLLAQENLFVQARRRGLSVRFANAYPERYLERVPSRRVAGPTLAADAAGLLVRHHRELERGEAVATGIVNRGWRKELGFSEVPEVSPEEAGRNLARLAGGGHLTFFAHYGTDHAGHRGGWDGAVAALEQVDRFLGGILDALPPDVTLLVASDHGNIEDVESGHTRNPALGLAVGPGADELCTELRSITDVAPAILRFLPDPAPKPAS